jgi:AcrR family transcriptional regulator
MTRAETQRAERRAATRQRVLRAATRLVERRGFAGTRTIDVARATQLSEGAVFMHFPSREALNLAVAAELGRAITDRLHALVSDGCDLRAALLAHVQCLEENEDVYRCLLREGPLLPKGFQRTWTGLQSAVAHHLQRAAAVDLADKKLRRVAPHLLFNTWIGLLHHYLINRELFVTSGSVMKKHGRMLVDHYLALLAP